LQSLENISLPENDNAAFRALGNAVNSLIVRLIATELLIELEDDVQVNDNNEIQTTENFQTTTQIQV